MKRSKKEVLDADFAAARAGVLDVAAFLDRVDRGEGEADFRYHALMDVLPLLSASGPVQGLPIVFHVPMIESATAISATFGSQPVQPELNI